MKRLNINTFKFLLVLLVSNSYAQEQIAIVKLEPISKAYLDRVASVIKIQFNNNVVFLSSGLNDDSCKSNIDTVICASCVNKTLKKRYLGKYKKILAITSKPLTIFKDVHPNLVNKQLVRGYTSSVGGFCATISLYRIIIESDTEKAAITNFKKVLAHELGHLFGLEHCASHNDCLMADGFNFMDNSGQFCPSCRSKLDSLSGL